MDINKLDEVIDELEKESAEKEEKERILEIRRKYRGPDEVIDAETLKKILARDKPSFKAMSGLKGLDTILDGFRPGGLYIVSGPTKQGKTTFCQTLTYHFWKQKYQSLWFSFDTPPGELIDRFPKDKVPIFYLPRRNEMTDKITWIESKIIESIAKFDVKIVFIDHLESIAGYNNNAPNYSSELQSLSKQLKEIAMRWNIVIILNHHLRQIGEKEIPNWTQLKNSSGPAQESDATIMIWRNRISSFVPGEAVYEDTANISVQLNRRTGKTGNIRVNFKNGLFDEFPNKETNGRDTAF